MADMITSHARVATTDPGRYLARLRTHTGRMAAAPSHALARHRHDGPSRTEWSDTDGVIEFDRGRCTLRVAAGALLLDVEADDPEALRRVREVLTARLEKIGHRDGLTVEWAPSAQEIFDALLTPEGRADPFVRYAQAHVLGPVSALTGGAFLVCGYAAADQVLRDPGFGMAGPGQPPAADDVLGSLGRSILRADPPDHPRMRSLISRVFTPRRVSALRPEIERIVDDLLDRLNAGDALVDFMDAFAYRLPVTVICALLGVDAADSARFRPLAADLTEVLELSTGGERAAVAANELADHLTPLIERRRRRPEDDLISALVAVRDGDDGRLSDTELLANLILLLVAGFETTTNLLGNGLALMLQRPHLQAAIRAGDLPVEGFVEEVLRYDSPVQAVLRHAHADGLTVAGVPIPAGSRVILLVGAANRDPARYNDPGLFDPFRTDIRPLSFGAGPHVCIGNSLARTEASVAFSRLLDRFPAMNPAGPPTRRDRLVLRGYQTLPISLFEAWVANV
jgi:cytochrome P450